MKVLREILIGLCVVGLALFTLWLMWHEDVRVGIGAFIGFFLLMRWIFRE